jgi:hypothetical protein
MSSRCWKIAFPRAKAGRPGGISAFTARFPTFAAYFQAWRRKTSRRSF